MLLLRSLGPVAASTSQSEIPIEDSSFCIVCFSCRGHNEFAVSSARSDIRIGFLGFRCPGTPPGWQISLSLVLLLFATVGTMYASAEIYRVGILRYGKRPSLVEMLRWLRYS
jgi:hypothetical protein